MSVTTETRARLKDFGKTSDLFNIRVDDIEIDPEFNIRLDTPELAAHVDWLRGQILEFGYMRSKPLIVRLTPEKRVVLVDGHCRLAAVRLAIAEGATIHDLPCLPEGKGVSVIDRTVMLFTANGGLNMSPLEQAAGVKRLLGWGLSETEIGRRIGRTRQHVANLLELAGAPIGVQVMVANGVVSATEAVKTVRAEGSGATKLLEAAAVKAKESGKGKVTASTIKATKTPPAPPPAAPQPPRPPRVLERVKVPLSITAAHVVEMAKGLTLPADLRRAIDALHESLT
jgi:ParB family chromosome partitioning protein